MNFQGVMRAIFGQDPRNRPFYGHYLAIWNTRKSRNKNKTIGISKMFSMDPPVIRIDGNRRLRKLNNPHNHPRLINKHRNNGNSRNRIISHPDPLLTLHVKLIPEP